MTPEPRLFDIPGCVAYLKSVGANGASISFIRGLVGSGQLPFVRIGKRFYISKISIDTWLAKAERRGRA